MRIERRSCRSHCRSRRSRRLAETSWTRAPSDTAPAKGSTKSHQHAEQSRSLAQEVAPLPFLPWAGVKAPMSIGFGDNPEETLQVCPADQLRARALCSVGKPHICPPDLQTSQHVTAGDDSLLASESGNSLRRAIYCQAHLICRSSGEFQYCWRDGAARSRAGNVIVDLFRKDKLIHVGPHSNHVSSSPRNSFGFPSNFVSMSRSSDRADASATSPARRSTAAGSLLSLETEVEYLHPGP